MKTVDLNTSANASVNVCLKQKRWFPRRLDKWENIFQSKNFGQTGEVREFYMKYWKIKDFLHKILEKLGNLDNFYCFFSVI